MPSACAVCGGGPLPCLRGLHDDRYGYPGRFDLLECTACGHRQLDAALSEADLRRLYTEYYPDRLAADGRLDAPPEPRGLRAWLDGERAAARFWVPRGVRVLDVGSGAGRSLAYHRSRGCDAWGVEADERAGTIAAREGLQVRVGAFDPSMFEAASFDVVTLDQVLEHAVDPVRLLRGVAALLKPGGLAIASTPNSRGLVARLARARWLHWHVPYHLHQFSRASLRRAAAAAGLDCEALRTLTNSAWLLFQQRHLAAFPPPGRPSAVWGKGSFEAGAPRLAFGVASMLHALRLNHLATRALDAMGAGDNFLCILRKPAA